MRCRIDDLKKNMKPGTRIKLIKMHDPQSPPLGTTGTVYGVDDIGSVLVRWETGSLLNVFMDQDEISVISSQSLFQENN